MGQCECTDQQCQENCKRVQGSSDGDSKAVGQALTFAKDMQRESRPEFIFDTGATYTGEWVGTQRDGQGSQVWADGARYEGQWKEDKAHGRGRFTHSDGDVYE